MLAIKIFLSISPFYLVKACGEKDKQGKTEAVLLQAPPEEACGNISCMFGSKVVSSNGQFEQHCYITRVNGPQLDLFLSV